MNGHIYLKYLYMHPSESMWCCTWPTIQHVISRVNTKISKFDVRIHNTMQDWCNISC